MPLKGSMALLIYYFLLTCLQFTRGENIVINTSLGPVQGLIETGFYSFKGIPYGETTAGKSRWKSPTPKAAWSPKTLDASQYGDCCAQRPASIFPNISENCLYLNIWTPIPTNASTQYPVMVWIHGGGFMTGCSTDPGLVGDWYAANQSIVVVNINYRLSALGFLDTPSLGTGNYGMMDQQLALIWVQKNIASFYGNPKEVTILGESAGGMAVFLHMFIPSSYGLYNRVIVESNPVSLRYRTPAEDVKYSDKFARHVGCGTPDNVTCLYELPMEKIVAYDGVIEWIIENPLNSTMILPWCPAIDGTFLPAQPIDVLPLGKFNKVPVIWGTTKNETDAFLPDIPIVEPVYVDVVKDIWGPVDSPKVLAMYPPQGNHSRIPALQLSVDYLFHCPNRYAAWAWTNYTNFSTYIETWMRPTVDAAQYKCINASCHACELPYVWHTLDGNPNHPPPIPQEDYQLSLDVISYWAAFVQGKMDTKADSGAKVVWPVWDHTNLKSLFMDSPVTVTTGYRAEFCDFWDQLGYNV